MGYVVLVKRMMTAYLICVDAIQEIMSVDKILDASTELKLDWEQVKTLRKFRSICDFLELWRHNPGRLTTGYYGYRHIGEYVDLLEKLFPDIDSTINKVRKVYEWIDNPQTETPNVPA